MPSLNLAYAKTHKVETFSSSCFSCRTATSPRSTLRLLFSTQPSGSKAVGVMAVKGDRKRGEVFVSSVLRPNPTLSEVDDRRCFCCCRCCWRCFCCSSRVEHSTDSSFRLHSGVLLSVGLAPSPSTPRHGSAKATHS